MTTRDEDNNNDTPRILVVDDEPDISESLRFLLEQEGYQVKTAANGYEALGAIRAWEPHLVLLDVMIPGENGYRVSRLVKEDEERGLLPRTAVVLVTARKLDDPERESTFASFSRADAVIYKPFDIDDVLAAARKYAPTPWVAPAQV